MKKIFVTVLFILFCSHSYSQILLLCDFNTIDALSASISNDTVCISNIKLCGYCSAKYSVEISKYSDSLVIIQTDTAGIIATCECLFDLNMSISGLAPGNYKAIVKRAYYKKYGYQLDTVMYVGTVSFAIQEQPNISLALKSVQSQCITSSVKTTDKEIPDQYILYQNYPNPFNPETNISFEIPKGQFVSLKIFDILGKEIETLLDGYKSAGRYRLNYNASVLKSGIYFYQLRLENFSLTKKMVVLR